VTQFTLTCSTDGHAQGQWRLLNSTLFEAIISASDAPAVVIIDRALIRGLIRYVRELEARAQAAQDKELI
jgi:hypothetical protein